MPRCPSGECSHGAETRCRFRLRCVFLPRDACRPAYFGGELRRARPGVRTRRSRRSVRLGRSRPRGSVRHSGELQGEGEHAVYFPATAVHSPSCTATSTAIRLGLNDVPHAPLAGTFKARSRTSACGAPASVGKSLGELCRACQHYGECASRATCAVRGSSWDCAVDRREGRIQIPPDGPATRLRVAGKL